MSMPPPKDEERHVRRDESKREPPLLYSAVSRPERGASDESLASRSRLSSITVFSFVGGFLLLLLAILAIWIYFSEQEPPRPEPLAGRDTQRKPALSGKPPVTAASPPAAGRSVCSSHAGHVPRDFYCARRHSAGHYKRQTSGGR